MESPLIYVLTDKEYIKLKGIVRPSKSDELPASKVLIPRANAEKLRPFIRLFIKAWAASFVLNRTLLKRRKKLNSLQIASVLASAAGSFRILHSKFSTSVIGGFGSGAILAIGLPSEATVYLTLYFVTKLTEWGYSYASIRHWLDWVPHQVGAWMIVPLAYSQLFYTFFAHPERVPASFKRFIVRFSNGALDPQIGAFQLTKSTGMSTDDVAKAIFRALYRRFPVFSSPLLLPTQQTLSATSVKSITSPSMMDPPINGLVERLVTAHPGKATAISALMHPTTDSGQNFWFQTFLKNLQSGIKILIPLYSLRAYLGRKTIKPELLTALRTVLTYSLMFTSSLSGISLSQYCLGAQVSPRLRLRLLGFISGLSAVLIKQTGQTQFLYMARLALATTIPVSAQRALSITVLPVALGLTALIMEKKAELVRENYYFRALHWLQTGQWSSSCQ